MIFSPHPFKVLLYHIKCWFRNKTVVQALIILQLAALEFLRNRWLSNSKSTWLIRQSVINRLFPTASSQPSREHAHVEKQDVTV